MANQKKVVLYTYKYMWTLSGDERISFKVITDTEEGHKLFIDGVKSLPNLDKAAREYLSEIDVSKFSVCEEVYRADKAKE